MANDICVILVTCRSVKEADGIASALLKKRLVACANLMPDLRSKFWWGGKINKSNEVLVTLKTKLRNFKSIAKEVKRLHSYAVPEIIAIPVIAGSEEYLKWINSSTGQ